MCWTRFSSWATSTIACRVLLLVLGQITQALVAAGHNDFADLLSGSSLVRKLNANEVDAYDFECAQTPWVVAGGNACEPFPDEQGCIQTKGYPINFTGSGDCSVMARRGGYIIYPVDFDTKAWDGSDPSTGEWMFYNRAAYTGSTLKAGVLWGHLVWWSHGPSHRKGWKICPRSSCTALPCPPYYRRREKAHEIPCHGLNCTLEADLDTCCEPVCSMPADMGGAYARGCSEFTDYPGYWAEFECIFACQAPGAVFEVGRPYQPFCQSPGGEFVIPKCVYPPEGMQPVPWTIEGDCVRFSLDCVQSANMPNVRNKMAESECYLSLPQGYLISIEFMELEDGFDFIETYGNPWRVSGRDPLPDPFLLPEGRRIRWHTGGTLRKKGFRACARSLCSIFTCPVDMVFRCEQLDAVCDGPYCDADTCCRNATSNETEPQQDAISAGCVTTTTSTTTTTTTLPAQMIGQLTISLPMPATGAEMEAAWHAVLMEMPGVPPILPPTFAWVFSEENPSATEGTNQTWRLGFEVHYGAHAIDFLLAQSNEDLTNMLNAKIGPDQAAAEVLAVIAASGDDWSGPYVSSGLGRERAKCINLPGWIDDHQLNCDIWIWWCNRDGTSSGELERTSPFTFEQVLFRTNPDDPKATEACCPCGGGICLPGTFALRGGSNKEHKPYFCTPCTPGRFSDVQDLDDDCKPCPLGYYTDLMGQRQCIASGPGYHVPELASLSQTPCEPGYFTNESGQGTCKSCEPGHFNLVEAAQSCLQCQPGQFMSNSSSTACDDCPPGHFTNFSGATACDECFPGTVAATDGFSQCTNCEAGSANPDFGATSCSPCGEGFMAPAEGSDECLPCMPGDFGDTEGLTSCPSCPGGSDSSVYGATECDQCSIGKYKTEENMLQCENCPFGRFGIWRGATECDACDLGQYGNDEGLTECSGCEQGYYSDTLGVPNCTACSPGFYQPARSSTACAECNPGWFTGLSGESECSICPKGTGASALRSSRCDECDHGQFQPDIGQTACMFCAAGSYAAGFGNSECTNCLPGRFAPVMGVSSCSHCDPGWYADTMAMSECKPCEVGMFVGSSESTGCSACSAFLPGPGQHWVTLAATRVDGEVHWDEMQGATNLSACGCRAGTQPSGAADINYVDGGPPADAQHGRGHGCSVCHEGLLCLGMGKLRIAPGYAWNGGMSVYDCDEAFPDACPGGIPGECAAGRDPASPACAQCLDNRRETSEGTCEECTAANYIVPLLVLSSALILEAVLYGLFRRRPSTSSAGFFAVFFGMATGQSLEMLQHMGIISTADVNWPSELRDVLKFIASVAFFDMPWLRPGCIVTTGPVGSYISHVAAIYCVLGALIVGHLVSYILQRSSTSNATDRQRQKEWRKSVGQLCNVLGTTVMTLFIAMTTTALAPFDCQRHPNGKKTVAWYPSALCWEGSHHVGMLIVGLLALIPPLVFVAVTIWAIAVFPKKLAGGEQGFLRVLAFLFLRFTTDGYFYGVVVVIHGSLLSVVPSLPDGVFQVLYCQVVVLMPSILVLRLTPWRAEGANVLEAVRYGVFLFMSMIATFCAKNEPGEILGWFGLLVILIMPLTILCFIFLGASRLCRRRNKPYQFFLCHHKAGAGSFARLLKMKLTAHVKVTRKVFIDTDDLRNLDTLFDIVATAVETLVEIHTSQLLFRPWCVGEIVTAHSRGLKNEVLRFLGVHAPTKEFIAEFSTHVPDIACLTEKGISTEMIAAALNNFASLPAIYLHNTDIGDRTLSKLVATMLGMGDMKRHLPEEDVVYKPQEPEQLVVPDGGLVLIVTNHIDLESASVAYILRLLLHRRLARRQAIAHVLAHDEDLPVAVSKAVVICTTGMFESHIIRSLADLARNPPQTLPVISSKHFATPSQAMLLSIPTVKELDEESQRALLAFIQAMFSEVPVVFDPAGLSQTERSLQLGAQEVEVRFWGAGAALPSSQNAVKAIGHDSSLQGPPHVSSSRSRTSRQSGGQALEPGSLSGEPGSPLRAAAISAVPSSQPEEDVTSIAPSQPEEGAASIAASQPAAPEEGAASIPAVQPEEGAASIAPSQPEDGAASIAPFQPEEGAASAAPSQPGEETAAQDGNVMTTMPTAGTTITYNSFYC